MTWLSIYNAFVAFIFLVSCIFWNLNGLNIFIYLAIFSALFLWLETASKENSHFLDSFWLFILSEILVFGSLLVSCLWFIEENNENLSNYMEIPFFGCFLLIGSSVTITFYHHTMGYYESNLHLIITILLGVGFVVLQFIEFSECIVNMTWSVYHSSCFSTVGLHFSHVFIGLVLLINLLLFGESVFGGYYSTLFVWYWHFVDYIWLLVYLVVYLC